MAIFLYENNQLLFGDAKIWNNKQDENIPEWSKKYRVKKLKNEAYHHLIGAVLDWLTDEVQVYCFAEVTLISSARGVS